MILKECEEKIEGIEKKLGNLKSGIKNNPEEVKEDTTEIDKE